jgi:hypothetical protein
VIRPREGLREHGESTGPPSQPPSRLRSQIREKDRNLPVVSLADIMPLTRLGVGIASTRSNDRSSYACPFRLAMVCGLLGSPCKAREAYYYKRILATAYEINGTVPLDTPFKLTVLRRKTNDVKITVKTLLGSIQMARHTGYSKTHSYCNHKWDNDGC